jgi:hypothetical protein
MITQICRLHKKLDQDTEIVIKLATDERQTIIQEEDILEKVNYNTLKVTKPKGEIRLINADYIMIVYYGRRALL